MNIATRLKNIFQWKQRAKTKRQYALMQLLRPRIYRWYEDYYSGFNLILPTDIIKSAEKSTDNVLCRLMERNEIEKYRNRLPYKEMLKCI